MPKSDLHTINHGSGYRYKVVEEVETPPVVTTKIRLLVDANYRATGKFSGRGYLFQGAGSVNDVEQIDVEWFLSLRRAKGCCGGGGGNPIFELA